MGRAYVIDDDLFRAMWTAGAAHRQIAAALAIPEGSVGNHMTRLGLTSRRQRRGSAAPLLAASAAVSAPLQPPVLPAHPFWTPERDLAVMAGAGRHAAMTHLARSLGRPVADVQMRWHRLRSAA